MNDLVADLRFALRSLTRRPAMSLAVLSVLALGIGAAVGIFTVLDAVLLRPLGYPEPERLVRIVGTSVGDERGTGTIAWRDLDDWRRRSTSFAAMSAYDEWEVNLTGDGSPERLDGALVGSGFFEVLGVEPAVGRFFVPEEDVDGQDRVVVLSHGLWQRRWGGDPTVVGRRLTLGGREHTVVGVTREGFEDPLLSGTGGRRAELWRPLGFAGVAEPRLPNRGSRSYTAIGRLAPGRSFEAAASELAAVARQVDRENPETNAGRGIRVVRLADHMLGPIRDSLRLLVAAVLFLLLIATANAAHLLLTRATERQAEAAVRTALGAGRARLARSLAAEGLCLAVVAAALGLVIAAWSSEALLALAGEALPRGQGVALDLRAVGFAASLSFLTGFACGLAPALVLVRRDFHRSLRDGRSELAAHRGSRLRDGLVVVQVAVSLALLLGAGLLLESFWRLTRVDAGIDPEGVLTFEIDLPWAAYPEAEQAAAFFDRLLPRLAALPGVEAAATTNILPLAGGFDGSPVRAADRAAPAPAEEVSAESRTVSRDYFEVMGLELLAGRAFDARERADAPPATAVTAELARRLWPGRDPVGRRVVAFDRELEVIGVAADVKHLGLDQPAPPRLYLIADQRVVPWHGRSAVVVMKVAGDPLAVAAAARRQVWTIDSDVAVAALRTMDEVIAASVARPRLRAALLAAFATVALLLAAVGIYGSLAYAVTQRRFELAMRLALGAPRRRLLVEVIRRAMTLVGLGLATGLAGALLLGRAVAGLLFGVRADEPHAVAVVVALLLGVALMASWLPARRASRLDPAAVLRS